jgi:hypothetical protein
MECVASQLWAPIKRIEDRRTIKTSQAVRLACKPSKFPASTQAFSQAA